MITYYRMPRYPSADDFILHDGLTFRVEWYYSDSGEMPARDYYLNLSDGEQTRLLFLVKHMADRPFGSNRLPETMYRIEDKTNKIYVFKPNAHRFFNFTTEGRAIIITNAYRKHSNKMTRADLEILAVSAKNRQDYLRRTQEGTYYEESK